MKATTQQINLYQTSFQKTRVLLSAVQALRLSLVLVVALGITSALTLYETMNLESTAGLLSQQLQSLSQQADEYNKRRDSAQAAPKDAISQLKKIRAQRQRILSNLSSQQEHRNRLFSSYFEGLARRTLDGLWFEDIKINQGGQSIALSGNTYKAELIPELITALKKEPAFQGITFRRATVSGAKSDDADGQLSFSLLTHHETSEGTSE